MSPSAELNEVGSLQGNGPENVVRNAHCHPDGSEPRVMRLQRVALYCAGYGTTVPFFLFLSFISHHYTTHSVLFF